MEVQPSGYEPNPQRCQGVSEVDAEVVECGKPTVAHRHDIAERTVEGSPIVAIRQEILPKVGVGVGIGGVGPIVEGGT